MTGDQENFLYRFISEVKENHVKPNKKIKKLEEYEDFSWSLRYHTYITIALAKRLVSDGESSPLRGEASYKLVGANAPPKF